MIVLHLALFLDRTEAAGEPARILGQGVFDLFCREMDGHFREAGVSDLKVPKEMREMAEAFYGRRSVYRAALAAPDNDALEAALMRNVYLAQPGRQAGRGAACGLCPRGVGRLVARQSRTGRRATCVARSGRHIDRYARPGTRMKPMTDPGSVWSNPISIEDVPERGMHVDLVADEAARAEIAKIAGLRDLPRLTASFDITREGTDALRIAGEVSATVGQNCVVTLEPIENEIREGIDLLFASRAKGSIADSGGKDYARFQRSGFDRSRYARASSISAPIATEFLLLGIDPYPRKEGAVFDAPKAPEDPSKHPFAALEALKKARGGDKT